MSYYQAHTASVTAVNANGVPVAFSVREHLITEDIDTVGVAGVSETFVPCADCQPEVKAEAAAEAKTEADAEAAAAAELAAEAKTLTLRKPQPAPTEVEAESTKESS